MPIVKVASVKEFPDVTLWELARLPVASKRELLVSKIA
jgi:hypothetical protein